MFQTTQKNFSSELWHNQNVMDDTRQRGGKKMKKWALWGKDMFSLLQVLELFVEEGGNVCATWSKQF